MSPAAERLWHLAADRTDKLNPRVEAALSLVFTRLQQSLTEAELERFIASGAVEQLVRSISEGQDFDRAVLPLRARLQEVVERGFDFAIKDLPKVGKVSGQLAVQFNHLNPRVLDALTELDSTVISSLRTDLQDVIRAHIENGLRDGVGTTTIARRIRDILGVGPTQLEQSENYRLALKYAHRYEELAGDPAYADLRASIAYYATKDPAIRKAAQTGKPIPAASIETRVTRYLTRAKQLNAQNVAGSAVQDSYRLGQFLSWQDARSNGVVPPGYEVVKEWSQINRPTKRPEHEELAGEVQPIDQPYSNGSMIPGDQGEPNCGCQSLYRLRRIR